jgi:hypothetical protein
VIHRGQGVIDEPADGSQGMILPDAFLQVDVGKQRPAPIIATAH